jgi:anti-anti-sigma regulatory factor
MCATDSRKVTKLFIGQSIFREKIVFLAWFGHTSLSCQYLENLDGRELPTLRNEENFPTVKFHKCRACGQVYTGSLSGQNNCPKCREPAQSQVFDAGHFKLVRQGRHALFSIQGSVLKIEELEVLRAQIDELPMHETDSMAFEFQSSAYLNSSLIGLLVRTLQTLSKQGKPIFIITSEASTLESLQTMDLDRVMKIVPSLEKYRAALG